MARRMLFSSAKALPMEAFEGDGEQTPRVLECTAKHSLLSETLKKTALRKCDFDINKHYSNFVAVLDHAHW